MYKRETYRYPETGSIDLSRIKGYTEDARTLRELLEDCKQRGIRIVFEGRTVEPEWMAAVYKMIIDRTHEELKAEQYKGIKRALKRKAEGTGSYGRPRAKLPADFEKQLKERIRKQEDLSSYCKDLEMKKSTFYKWVKIYRSTWDSEKINSN